MRERYRKHNLSGDELLALFLGEATQEGACLVSPRGAGNSGYPVVRYEGAHTTLHRVVLQIVSGSGGEGKDAGHLCDNRRCINPAHLVWQTRQENMEQCVRNGRHLIVLTPEVVAEIKQRVAAGEYQRDVAASLGVSRGSVYNALNKRRCA